jgi:hypothetical protein
MMMACVLPTSPPNQLLLDGRASFDPDSPRGAGLDAFWWRCGAGLTPAYRNASCPIPTIPTRWAGDLDAHQYRGMFSSRLSSHLPLSVHSGCMPLPVMVC